MKSKLLLTCVLFTIIGACSPKIESSIKSKFNLIEEPLKLFNGDDIRPFAKKYPNYEIVIQQIKPEFSLSNLEKEALKLSVGEQTSLVLNEDNSCGIMKVIEKEESELLRVQYIYLNDNTEKGEEIGKMILTKYHNGDSFESLAEKYSKDGNSKRGGDLGWVKPDSLIPDFTKAIRDHNKGEVFSVNTEAYGWYVIHKTHNIKVGENIQVVHVYNRDCR